MFMTDKDLKKVEKKPSASTSRKATTTAQPPSTNSNNAATKAHSSLSVSTGLKGSSATPSPANSPETPGGGGVNSILLASQMARQERLGKLEMGAKAVRIQKWYRGRKCSSKYFSILRTTTEKKLSDVETVTKVLAAKNAAVLYVPPSNVVVELLLSAKVLCRGGKRNPSLPFPKLLQFIIVPSFKSPDLLKFVCTQALGSRLNPNPTGISLLLWLLQSVVFEMMQKSLLKKLAQPEAMLSMQCFQLLQTTCHSYRPIAAGEYSNSAIDVVENVDRLIGTIRNDMFALLNLASSEVLSQLRLRNDFPTIREFSRWISSRGANFSNFIDVTIIDTILYTLINPQLQIIPFLTSPFVKIDLLHQVMDIPVIMSLLSPNAVAAFFNNFVVDCLGSVTPHSSGISIFSSGSSSNNSSSSEYIGVVRRKYIDTDVTVKAYTLVVNNKAGGIESSHWFCGNFLSFFTIVATLPSIAQSQSSPSLSSSLPSSSPSPLSSSSSLQGKLVLADNQIQVYIATCNLLLRKLHFPGFFQGKSGVFMVKSTNSLKSGVSTAVSLPVLLQAQLYSIYDAEAIKLMFKEYFSCIETQFPVSQGNEADSKEISESLKQGSGYRAVSRHLASDQKASASMSGMAGRWASKLLSTISSPFSSSASQDSLPKKVASSTFSSSSSSSSFASSTVESAKYIRKELHLSIVSLLTDMWAVMFIPTGSDVSIATVPWQTASQITHSTDIIASLWILILNQSSQGINFGNAFTPTSSFYPSGEMAWLSALVAILNIKLLTLDDEELFNSDDPLPLHQVLPLVRILNTILFKIVGEYPSLFEDGPTVVSSQEGRSTSNTSGSNNKAKSSSSSSSGFFSFLPFYSSSSSSVTGSGSKKSLVNDKMDDSDFNPINLRLFRYHFARSVSIVLSDFYTRWSRKPFSSPNLWILSEANSSTMLKSLEGLGSSGGAGGVVAAGGGGADAGSSSGTTATSALTRLVRDCDRYDQQVALSLLRVMPWSISFVERMKLVRKHLDDEKFRIQGTNDILQMHLGAFRSKGTVVRIRRCMVVEDGIRAFDTVQHSGSIKDRIVVQYINDFGESEMGIDAGGLFKDLLCDLSAKVFNPNYGLFCQTSSNLLYPNPVALKLFGGVSEAEELYTFVGKILGKALFENITIQSEFSHFFLGFINGKYDFTHLLDDLKMLDPELHKNLLFLKTYDGDIRDLSLNFAVTDNSLGTNAEVELVPGGSKIDVTSENRHRYIHSVAKYYLHDRIKVQSKAFFRGLHQVVDPELLKVFCPPELQVLISGGLVAISIEDWKANTSYGHGYISSMDRTIQKFWTVVGELDERNLSLLLKFVTACDRPPSLGFSQLQPQFTIHRADDDNPDDRLPTASTCFNILKLPSYSSSKILRDKLLHAIQSGSGFDLS